MYSNSQINIGVSPSKIAAKIKSYQSLLLLKPNIKTIHAHRYLTLGKASIQKEGVSADAADVYRKAEIEFGILINNIQTDSNPKTTDKDKTIRPRLRSITSEMETNLIERSTEVRLLLLAAIAGENIFFIGPPGTGKSELGRRLSSICSGSYFERLLTKFSVPEELFGPLSMRALEEDQYVRHTSGYLPESRVAFIDEIFKANSAILNSLLTILNERLFDNGNRRYRIPLLCLVGASNEVPDTEELDALYDRFLLRKMVHQVSAKGFSDLICTLETKTDVDGSDIHPIMTQPVKDEVEKNKNSQFTMTDSEIVSLRTEAHRIVRIPDEVALLVSDIRDFVQTKMEPTIYLSDRRLLNAIKMLKVAAYTNGRSEVSPIDCVLLQHCLWQNPAQQDPIFEFLIDKLCADNEVPNFEIIMQRIFARSCLVLTGAAEDNTLRDDLEILQKKVISRLEQLTSNLVGALPVLTENIWISPVEVSSLAPNFVRKTTKSKKMLENLLMESEVLKIILDTKREPSVCAELLGARWADFLKTPLSFKGVARSNDITS